MSRLTEKDALSLLQNADLRELGTLAYAQKKRLHPKNITTFVVDRNINYTNICVAGCKFCAFKRGVNDEDGYLLDFGTIGTKIEELLDIGGTQILFQGGVHPKLTIEYYEELVGYIHTKYPQITIHGFSAAEIAHIAKLSEITIKETLIRLKQKGLSSIPGAVVCAILLGVSEAVATEFIAQGWSDIIAYAALLLVLFFFPQGLFGGGRERV